jgi:hypothetical protein
VLISTHHLNCRLYAQKPCTTLMNVYFSRYCDYVIISSNRPKDGENSSLRTFMLENSQRWLKTSLLQEREMGPRIIGYLHAAKPMGASILPRSWIFFNPKSFCGIQVLDVLVEIMRELDVNFLYTPLNIFSDLRTTEPTSRSSIYNPLLYTLP